MIEPAKPSFRLKVARDEIRDLWPIRHNEAARYVIRAWLEMARQARKELA